MGKVLWGVKNTAIQDVNPMFIHGLSLLVMSLLGDRQNKFENRSKSGISMDI